jgi:hypothetical protein
MVMDLLTLKYKQILYVKTTVTSLVNIKHINTLFRIDTATYILYNGGAFSFLCMQIQVQVSQATSDTDYILPLGG